VYYPIPDIGDAEHRMDRIANIMETLGIKIQPTVLPLQIIDYTNPAKHWSTVIEKVTEIGVQFVDYEKSLDPNIFNEIELDVLMKQLNTSSTKPLSVLAYAYRAGWLDQSGNVLPLSEYPQKTVVATANQTREVFIMDTLMNRVYQKNNDRLLNNVTSAYSPIYTPLLMYNDKELFESAKDDQELLNALLAVHKCHVVENAFCGECDQCVFRREILFDLDIVDPTKYVFI
jgi:hypothetical protein